MTEIPDYVHAVQDLKYWQEGQHFFTCELYSLMAKADSAKFARLAIAFPVKAKAFWDWNHSLNEGEFFDSILPKIK